MPVGLAHCARWRAVRVMAPGLLLSLALLAVASVAQAQTYRIGAGDVIEVQIVGEAELSAPAPGLTVGPDGRIVLPFVGELTAAGATTDELQQQIRDALVEGQILLDPVVMVRVREFRSQVYNVLGAVRNPGTFPFRGGLTIRDALAQAGGLIESGTGAASRSQARLIRPDGAVLPVSLTEALGGGGDFARLELEAGDTLVVDQRGNIVVIGRVTTPGVIEVDGPTHLSELIARSGGVTVEGDPSRITIRRKDGSLESTGLAAAGPGGLTDPVVEPGETVLVGEVEMANIVGAVTTPGRYPVRLGMRVSDLISAAGGPAIGRGTIEGGGDPRGDLSQIVLSRPSSPSVVVNLTEVLLRGSRLPEDDPVISAGDSVYVPEERLEVSVLGHVALPGRYTLRPGDRVSDALARAGGPLRPTTVNAPETAADLSHSVLHRVGGQTITLDLGRLLQDPTSDDNVALQQGDMLYIPESENRVMVAGYVTTPGYYAFREGDTVASAIAIAGGVLTNVGSNRAIAVRHRDGQEETVDLQAADLTLRGGDLVSVPFARLRVAVLGYVTRPGVFEWHEGDTVTDMLAQAGGPVLENGNVYRAVLIRRTKGTVGAPGASKPEELLAWVGERPKDKDRTVKGDYEVVDLGKLYDKGMLAGDPPVQPDDIIFVPKSDHTNYSDWLGNIESGLVIWNLLQGIF